ncbi:TRAF-like protein [Mycena latifolia]|nr:TRAF-like protein [Mycena latifolia]
MMDVLDERPDAAHKAFAAKHMPDPGCSIKDFQVYKWRLNNWKKLDKSLRLKSDEFECGAHKWRVWLAPFGNSQPPNDTVSVYLNCVVPKNAPPGWYASAQFAIVISNIHDPAVFTIAHTQHRFLADELGWGFARISQLHKLFRPQIEKGESRPTIEEDAAEITVYLRVLEDQSDPPAVAEFSSLTGAVQDLFRVFHVAERASSCMRSKLTALENELRTAHRKAHCLMSDLEIHKNECGAAETALKDEKAARIAVEDRLRAREVFFESLLSAQQVHCEDRLRTQEATLEAREAAVRAAEEEMRTHRAAVEEDLKRTMLAMQDSAEMHVERLSAQISDTVHATTSTALHVLRRPYPSPSEGEPPAKRLRFDDTEGTSPVSNLTTSYPGDPTDPQVKLEAASPARAEMTAPTQRAQ